jgi:hypothetical protein
MSGNNNNLLDQLLELLKPHLSAILIFSAVSSILGVGAFSLLNKGGTEVTIKDESQLFDIRVYEVLDGGSEQKNLAGVNIKVDDPISSGDTPTNGDGYYILNIRKNLENPTVTLSKDGYEQRTRLYVKPRKKDEPTTVNSFKLVKKKQEKNGVEETRPIQDREIKRNKDEKPSGAEESPPTSEHAPTKEKPTPDNVSNTRVPEVGIGKSAPPPPAPEKKNTVYIQISKPDQEPTARDLQKSLNNAKFDAGEAFDKIEQITSTSQKLAIRYFYESDLSAAQRAKEIVRNTTGKEVSLESLVDYPEKEKPGTIEIWFPPQ